MSATISADDFDRDPRTVMEAAKQEAVFITHRGLPTRVLLSIEQYQNLARSNMNIVEQLPWPPGGGEVEFEAPRLSNLYRATDL